MWSASGPETGANPRPSRFAIGTSLRRSCTRYSTPANSASNAAWRRRFNRCWNGRRFRGYTGELRSYRLHEDSFKFDQNAFVALKRFHFGGPVLFLSVQRETQFQLVLRLIAFVVAMK